MQAPLLHWNSCAEHWGSTTHKNSQHEQRSYYVSLVYQNVCQTESYVKKKIAHSFMLKLIMHKTPQIDRHALELRNLYIFPPNFL